MGGPAVPTTNGGVLQHPYSYVQINIYDTNIKELQDRGVDIKHMLQHIGLRSVVMDVPILPSPPVNISVQTNARRAKSFGGFYLHARSAHSNSSTDNISVLNRTTEETGNIDVTSFEDNDSNCNETAVHDGNHTTLATSFIDSNISVVNRGDGHAEFCVAPLTSTPLTCKRRISFRHYMTSFIRSKSKSFGEGCCGDPKSCRNGQDIYQITDRPLQHEQSRPTANHSNYFYNDSKLPTKDITSVNNATTFQRCQEVVVDIPPTDDCVNAVTSSELPSSTKNATLPRMQTNSGSHWPSLTSEQVLPVEDSGEIDDITEADHSFTSFSREVVSALQSINPTSSLFMGDIVLHDELDQQCHSSSIEGERFVSKQQESQESINSKETNILNSERCLFPTAGINEESVYNTGISHQSYIAGKDVVEDIGGNELPPLSSLTLEEQELNEKLDSSSRSPSEIVSLRNFDLENAFTMQSATAGQCVRRKRARSISEDSEEGATITPKEGSPNDVKNESGSSAVKPIVPNQIFRCHMPGCGKRISWRPRYGKSRLVDHVRLHWAKALKRCKLCDFKALTCRKINHHHKNVHRDSPYMGALSIETREDLDELLVLWNQCFPGHLYSSAGDYYWCVQHSLWNLLLSRKVQRSLYCA